MVVVSGSGKLSEMIGSGFWGMGSGSGGMGLFIEDDWLVSVSRVTVLGGGGAMSIDILGTC